MLQRGLELLRTQHEAEEAETAALRALLEERDRGPFIGMKESGKRMERVIAVRRKRR